MPRPPSGGLLDPASLLREFTQVAPIIGEVIPGNSVRAATISLSRARTLGSPTGFTLEWDGAPRNIFDSYDNWNADQMLFFITPGGPGRCPDLLGAPFAPGRMTGSRTLASTSVHFP